MKKVLAFVGVAVLAAVISVSGAITHGTNQRAALAQSILDSCGATATVQLYAGASLVATVPLANPAFTRIGASLSLPATRSAAASDGGTITAFKVVGTSGSILFQGTVATSGADLTVDNATVVTGQAVNVTSLGYTSAP